MGGLLAKIDSDCGNFPLSLLLLAIREWVQQHDLHKLNKIIHVNEAISISSGDEPLTLN